MYQVNDDSFESRLTRKTYPFKKDQTGDDKRRALADLQRDEKVITDANNSRAGRTLGIREHLSGSWMKDTRPIRERMATEGKITSQPKRSPDENPHRRRIAEVNADHHLTAEQKTRRVEMITLAADIWDSERAASKERDVKLNDRGYKSARSDAETTILLIRTNPIFPTEWLRLAERRLANLNENFDTETYWRDTLEFETQRDAFLNETASRMIESANKMRSDANLVRDGEVIEPVTENASA